MSSDRAERSWPPGDAPGRPAHSGDTADALGSDQDGDAGHPIEASLRQFAESLVDLVWSARPSGFTDYYNRRFLEYLGRTADAMQGWTWLETLHPDDVLRSRQVWERAVATGTEYEVESRIRRHDGVYLWHRSHATPLRDDAGRITRWFGTCTDIDDRRRAMDRVRISEERFARFMAHVPGLAWIKDAEGRYVYANDAAVQAFGTPRKLLYGRTDDEIFPAETAAQFRAHDRQALECGVGVRVVETLKHPDGTIHHSLVSKFPIPRPDGTDMLVGGMAIDITDRLEMETALREADRCKDEFLATLAHELRNPLAPIRTALHLIGRMSDDPDGGEAQRAMAERQVAHLTRLVDDLLDVARINSGKVELRRQIVALTSVIDHAVASIRPSIEARGQRLDVSLPDEPLDLEADPTRLEQVLGNLLSNASKYTDRGGRVGVSAVRHGGEVVIRVVDSGIGIPPEKLPLIFDMFAQVDHRSTRAEGGLGIGLRLVKTLVELHGGTVSARSDGPATGAEFVVRLPAVCPPAGKATGGQAPDELRGKRSVGRRRVLIVDDNIDAAKSLALLFSRVYGQEVQVAHDGPSALAVAAEFRPELVLLDIGLPEMDGYEVATRLRAREGSERIFIVALTGWGQESDRRKSAEAGFDRHLVKPVPPEVLRELLKSAALAEHDERERR